MLNSYVKLPEGIPTKCKWHSYALSMMIRRSRKKRHLFSDTSPLNHQKFPLNLSIKSQVKPQVTLCHVQLVLTLLGICHQRTFLGHRLVKLLHPGRRPCFWRCQTPKSGDLKGIKHDDSITILGSFFCIFSDVVEQFPLTPHWIPSKNLAKSSLKSINTHQTPIKTHQNHHPKSHVKDTYLPFPEEIPETTRHFHSLHELSPEILTGA